MGFLQQQLKIQNYHFILNYTNTHLILLIDKYADNHMEPKKAIWMLHMHYA